MSWRDPIDEVYRAKRRKIRSTSAKEQLSSEFSIGNPTITTGRNRRVNFLLSAAGVGVGLIIGYVIGEVRLQTYVKLVEARFAAEESKLKTATAQLKQQENTLTEKQIIIDQYKRLVADLEAATKKEDRSK